MDIMNLIMIIIGGLIGGITMYLIVHSTSKDFEALKKQNKKLMDCMDKLRDGLKDGGYL